MNDFRVPAALAALFGLLLPLAELAVAAALVPASTAWWGAVGALALLLLFVVGLGANLARGRKPDCHCFGQLHSAPAGPMTLARNGVLAAVAAFIVWQGREGAGPSALSWVGGLSAAQSMALISGLFALALIGGQWWFLLNLLRQNGRLLGRLEALEARLGAGGAVPSANGTQQAAGLPVGSQAPAFSLSGLHGETLTLESLRSSDKLVMLVFTDPNCGPCTAMLPEVGRWQQEHSEKLTVSLVSRGKPEENRAKMVEHGLTSVLLQENWEVSEAYRVAGTPSAVLVSPDGTVGSPVVGGAEAIRALVMHAVGERAQLPMMQPQAQGQPQGEPCPNCGKAHPAAGQAAQAAPAGPKVGEDAPEVKLPDLRGEPVGLGDFRGEETLVLFWNPGCGFCQQMLPDLKE
jgi:peroxiredoxin